MMNREVLEQLEKWIDDHFSEMVADIKKLVAVPSVATYDEPDTPFGAGCCRALELALSMARDYGFETQNFDNRYGCATLRSKKEDIAFWGHLDVVPAGDGWVLTNPFVPIIKDGWLIGRGADDNKGPTIGVMYVLRAFEELKIYTRHGLKLYFGCDEEHGMRDVEYFAKHCAPDELTVIADCGFPVCYGEKGILEAEIVSNFPMENVIEMNAGIAGNIVPDKAEIVIKGLSEQCCCKQWVKVESNTNQTYIFAEGLSRHSAFPENSINAIHEATRVAAEIDVLSNCERELLHFFTRINDDYLGTALGIAQADEVSGYTTCVGTMTSLQPDGCAVLHLNIRYCISADAEDMMKNMTRICHEHGCTFRLLRDSAPNYYPRENPIVDAMTNVYNEITGDNKTPYVMGGGTYARKLRNAIGFGLGGLPRDESLFSLGHGGAHQPDEGLNLACFKKALLIFAMSILEADRVL